MTRVRCRWWMVAPSSFALSSLFAFSSQAQSQELGPSAAPPPEAPDRFTLVGQSETYFQLYRRALLPGANGASVPTETAAPIHQYLMANARGVDAPWQKDAISVEFAAWARLWPTSSSIERPFDGDVQTASVRLQAGPLWTSLGRQQVAGGAARYVRFDGLRVGAQQLGYFAE